MGLLQLRNDSSKVIGIWRCVAHGVKKVAGGGGDAKKVILGVLLLMDCREIRGCGSPRLGKSPCFIWRVY
jgi:hypothetical protein